MCMDLWAVAPEMWLAATALVMVAAAGFLGERRAWGASALAVVGLAGAIGLTARMLPWGTQTVFCGTYALDGFGTGFKLIVEGAALLAVFGSRAYFRGAPQAAHAPVLLVFATLGAVGLVASVDLGLIVLFVQMMSVASYLLVGLVRTDGRANEAALKIFLYGASALAVMIYGLSLLFGLAGGLSFGAIAHALAGADGAWAAVCLALVLVGYGFEATMVPFHFWAPDAYEGATAPMAAFLSVVPKVAGFAALARFLLTALPGGLAHWPTLLAVMAAATMTLGNLVALRQTSLKRLLAYSSIAQAGYLLMAVAASAPVALGYYTAAYVLMNLGAFGVVAALERSLGSDRRAGLAGLHRRSPWQAAVFALSLLSLAGIPPLAGFAGKVLIFAAVLEKGMGWLAVVGAVNMAIALYYYASLIALCYLEPPEGATPERRGLAATGLIEAAGTLALGLWPAPCLALLQHLAQLAR